MRYLRHILTLLFTFHFSLFTAIAATLSGKLVDKRSRQPLDFANVGLYLADGKLLTGTITDASGHFVIVDVKAGQYRLVCSFMGYTEQSREVTVAGKDINLGTIYLEEDAAQLQEVEVVAQGTTMRFELDKKVFSVDQNIASAGGSVTDVLENIPSVEVDQEGNIALRNNDAVEVWINGKPAGLTADNRAQVLQQIPAESIKEIEVITNPSAKYSPEGTAGIINLVMKKDRKAGYYGSVNGSLSYPLGAKYPGGNIGANINFSKGAVDGYFNAGYHYHNSHGQSITDRKNILNGDTITRLQKDGSTNRGGGGLFLRGGLDFRLGEHNTLGFSGFGIVADRSKTDNLSSYLLQNYPAGDTLRYYSRGEQATGGHPGGQAMMTYQFKYQKHDLLVTAAYNNFSFNNHSMYEQVENDTTHQWQNADNKNQSVQLKADYEWKPTQQSRMEAGWQTDLSWRGTLADAKDNNEQPINAYYNDFQSTEQIHALYVTYGNRFWDKLSLQVGLRGEYMRRHLSSEFYDQNDQQQVVSSDTSYFQLFPSVYLSYSFPKGHELQVNYTRRVDRPRGHQINPRMNFADSTSIQYGNPNLLPAYSSALELNYLKAWERHTLSAGFYYRFADGIIQNVYYTSGDVMRNTFINIAKRQDLGLELVAKNNLFKNILQLTTSLNFYYNTLSDADYIDPIRDVQLHLDKQQIFAWNARINASFMFTKTFTGQLSARYRSPRVVAQGTTSHSYSIDLGLRKTFFDRKLALAFNVRDVLNSRSRSNIKMSETFWQYSLNKWNSTTFTFSCTYSFGNMKAERKNRKMGDGGYSADMGGEGGGDD